jgi:membrane protease YdiL (CAAX protease family)
MSTTHKSGHVVTDHRVGVRPDVHIPQYSRSQITWIWAAAALPMAAAAWVVTPVVARALDGPTAFPRALIASLTTAVVWQFVLVMGLVRREQGSLRWSVVKQALWLQPPRSPSSGRRGGRLWLLVVPLAVLAWARELIPRLPAPESRDLGLFLSSDLGQTFLAGNWTWYAVMVVMFVFNTVLGEELLFRGFLLPRMNGAFGRGDWVANGLYFTAYHLHVPWALPGRLFSLVLLCYPAKRYQTALLGILVHSVQTVFFAVIGLGLVLG